MRYETVKCALHGPPGNPLDGCGHEFQLLCGGDDPNLKYDTKYHRPICPNCGEAVIVDYL